MRILYNDRGIYTDTKTKNLSLIVSTFARLFSFRFLFCCGTLWVAVVVVGWDCEIGTRLGRFVAGSFVKSCG
jgi:hypothetical protein